MVQQACAEVAGFSELYQRLAQTISISGKSESLLKSYASHLAKAAIYFNEIPTKVDSNKINEYLYYVQQTYQSASDSYFKFTVFGLRYAYRMEGLEEKFISLPSIKKEKKLPVVLSRAEIKRMLDATNILKHRVLIGLLYGCGLRRFETRNIQIADVDFDRQMLHVRKGKGKKDRYVPLSPILIEWLQEYIFDENPDTWLLNGHLDNGYSSGGIRWAIKQAATKAKIIKRVSAHTLRHSFATHLLEDGLDILSIKELLGHSRIETTLVYLHVARYERIKIFSPLDTLYEVRDLGSKTHNLCMLQNHLRECNVCSKTELAVLASRIL